MSPMGKHSKMGEEACYGPSLIFYASLFSDPRTKIVLLRKQPGLIAVSLYICPGSQQWINNSCPEEVVIFECLIHCYKGVVGNSSVVCFSTISPLDSVPWSNWARQRQSFFTHSNSLSPANLAPSV